MAKTSRTERRVRREAQLSERKAERRARVETDRFLSPFTVAFLLSGAAGLIHEVVWARLLGHLFGATSMAISTVLAAFMGGLAIGSYWIGSMTHRLADRRRTYAVL